jgi:predicted nuclease of predicted toxin-antitoxin system
MKIVIDQNISYRIIPQINHLFDEIPHVRMLGWTDASDIVIFRNARQNGFDAILTLDEDFDNIILENKYQGLLFYFFPFYRKQTL